MQKYKTVENITACKWFSNQKHENADDLNMLRVHNRWTWLIHSWSWCGMSGNVLIRTFSPVFDTVTFRCCAFYSVVRPSGGVSAEEGDAGQREGAVRTPYMGTPPTLRRYWLWALCSCLSTRWPSSSCRFDTDYFGIPREHTVKACVTSK